MNFFEKCLKYLKKFFILPKISISMKDFCFSVLPCVVHKLHYIVQVEKIFFFFLN
jgi:predicted aminopeptidase